MNHVNMRLAIAKVPYTRGLTPQLTQTLFWSGQLGVQIFFAVSGFLITSTALRRWGSLTRVHVLDFYKLRFARIAPLLLLLLGVLSVLHFAHVRDFVVGQKTGGLRRALLAALTFHINMLEAHRGYLPANWDILWSLSVEEMFYLFFPLICKVFGGGKWLMVILLFFVVMGPFGRTTFAHNGIWREYSYLGGMDAIALGCLSALLVAGFKIPRPALRWLGGAGSVLVIFSICFSIQAEKLSGVQMTVIAAGACLIMIAASATQWQSPGILRPLLGIGQRSYEVYLTHMFMVFVFFDLFVASGKPIGVVPELFLTVVVIAGLLGSAVARYYSEPMNRYLRGRFLVA